MKRLVFLFLMTGGLIFAVPPLARAQDSGNHAEIGIFGDYFRLGATRGPSLAGTGATSFGGVGARLSINVSRRWQIEPEMNYDFAASFSEGFTGLSGTVEGFSTSRLRILHGMIGPKIQTGGGALRAFLTVKGGGDDFMFSSAPVTFSTFISSVSGLRASSVVGVLYPGGGIEAYLGPIGLRLDVGDEIYFQSGPHNNLRITIGPSIRF
ncbi:MAG: hypothetical protein DMG32_08150 [Acidobacteria bacterium]|nr:MAG: hypothetical protein DMG32_08150 [Acidobacteriota bacterium]